jgi:hypothetical protein
MQGKRLAAGGFIFSVWLAHICVAAPVSAQPEASPPAKIANEWGGLDHQPTREGVRDAERARGIVLSSRQKQSERSELEAIQRQLLEGPPTAGP